MRLLLAIAVLGFGIAGGAARAADLPAGYSGTYYEHGQRSEMVWFYDDQPGVVVRAYWEAPWRYHHYFPITGIRPRLGRSENPSAVSRPQKPAQTYRRSWSNNWAVEHLHAGVAAACGHGRQPDRQPTRRAIRHAAQAASARRTPNANSLNLESLSNRMNTMINRPRKLALLAVIAAGLLPAAAAHAHWNCRPCARPAPLYPYHHRHYHRYVEARPLARSNWRRTFLQSPTACALFHMCAAWTVAAATCSGRAATAKTRR